MAGNYYLEKAGLERLTTKLRQRSLKGRRELAVQAGYAAHYAVYVHEDLQAFHPVGKAKYLSDPARRYRSVMGRIAAAVLRRKKSLELATYEMLEYLREKSQDEVPVDTGFLRESWFVRLA